MTVMDAEYGYGDKRRGAEGRRGRRRRFKREWSVELRWCRKFGESRLLGP